MPRRRHRPAKPPVFGTRQSHHFADGSSAWLVNGAQGAQKGRPAHGHTRRAAASGSRRPAQGRPEQHHPSGSQHQHIFRLDVRSEPRHSAPRPPPLRGGGRQSPRAGGAVAAEVCGACSSLGGCACRPYHLRFLAAPNQRAAAPPPRSRPATALERPRPLATGDLHAATARLPPARRAASARPHGRAAAEGGHGRQRRPGSASAREAAITGWITSEGSHPAVFAANVALNAPLVRTFSRGDNNSLEEHTEELSPAQKNAVSWAEGLSADIEKEDGPEAEPVAAGLPAGSSGKPKRSMKGQRSPRRLTRQMTLARCLSTDEEESTGSGHHPSRTAEREGAKGPPQQQQAGVTAWVGGIPLELARDEARLHELLDRHGGGGGGSSSDDEAEATTYLQSISIRIKELHEAATAAAPATAAPGSSEDGNASWCLATFCNDDAVKRLQLAAAEHNLLPPTIVVKIADVPRQLFTRKLESIHAGKLAGQKQHDGVIKGALEDIATGHNEKLRREAGAGAGAGAGMAAAGGGVEDLLEGLALSLSPRPPLVIGQHHRQQH